MNAITGSLAPILIIAGVSTNADGLRAVPGCNSQSHKQWAAMEGHILIDAGFVSQQLIKKAHLVA